MTMPLQLHGDVLEALVSYVPLIDLAPASDVSKEWNRAVFSSLRNLNPIKPWLLVHSSTTTTHAYDPRSHLWLHIIKPPPTSIIMSTSDSITLFCLTPPLLQISVDPLHLSWLHLPAPRVSRTDPIVAVIGDLVVVAGSACDFEDHALPVETYDTSTRAWSPPRMSSMPDFFKTCGSATWLAVACSDHQMFVTEKCSGVTHSFNPTTGVWAGPYHLHRSNSRVFFSTVGFANGRLIVVGLFGEPEDVRGVKIWEVKNHDTSSSSLCLSEIGEMPHWLIRKLMRDGDSEIDSLGVCCAGDYVYVYNPTVPDEVVVSEIRIGDGVYNKCEWSSVRNVAVEDARTRMGKLHFTASLVGVHDIQRALQVENWKFNVKT